MDHRHAANTLTGSRTVVITGGNTGLGFACANAILKSPNGAPWRVVLACRDTSRAQAAVDQLTSDAGVAGQVEAMSLDLASLASVRAFAAELTKRLSAGTIPPLHAVVCNAVRRPSHSPHTEQTITGSNIWRRPRESTMWILPQSTIEM